MKAAEGKPLLSWPPVLQRQPLQGCLVSRKRGAHFRERNWDKGGPCGNTSLDASGFREHWSAMGGAQGLSAFRCLTSLPWRTCLPLRPHSPVCLCVTPSYFPELLRLCLPPKLFQTNSKELGPIPVLQPNALFPTCTYLPGDWEKRVLSRDWCGARFMAMGWVVRRKEVAFPCPSLTALLWDKLTGQQFL